MSDLVKMINAEAISKAHPSSTKMLPLGEGISISLQKKKIKDCEALLEFS
jgi:hypothetical protein